jgi:hypothetical protein
MKNKNQLLLKNNIWILIEQFINRKILSKYWIYKYKRNFNNLII